MPKTKTRFKYSINLKGDERKRVEALMDGGVPEGEAIRQVLVVGAEQPAQTTVTTIVDLPMGSIMSPPGPSFPSPLIGPARAVGAQDANHHLEDCARAIVQQLDESWQVLILEMAQQVLKIPLWQVIAGNLVLQAERGEIQAAILDPRWGDSGTGIHQDTGICRVCNEAFKLERFGQAVCGPVCGSKTG